MNENPGIIDTDIIHPTLEKYGIRRLTPHSCRHTFGTLLSRAEANTVLKLIGHTDYAFTANNYTHLEIERLREEIEKI